MNETKKVLGKVDLVVTHVQGVNKEGKDFSFDYFSIKLDDVEIRINPRAEDKSLFEYKMGITRNAK